MYTQPPMYLLLYIHLSIYSSIYMSLYLSIIVCLSIYLFTFFIFLCFRREKIQFEQNLRFSPIKKIAILNLLRNALMYTQPAYVFTYFSLSIYLFICNIFIYLSPWLLISKEYEIEGWTERKRINLHNTRHNLREQRPDDATMWGCARVYVCVRVNLFLERRKIILMLIISN